MRLTRHAAVGFGVGGFILGSGSAPATPPTVALLQASPVVIAGSGYSAGAHMLVTYRSGGSVVRRHVRATIAGRFRVELKGISFKRCDGVQVSAPGASLRARACSAGGRPTLHAGAGGHVSGSAFVPGERVKVSVQIGGYVQWESVTAGRHGAFSSEVSLPHPMCADIDVRATGALGSTATYTVAMPACRTP